MRLNHFLSTIDIWNEKNIQKRAKLLATKALEIWKMEKLPTEKLQNFLPDPKEKNEYNESSYSTLKGEVYELYHLLRKRILNLDSAVFEDFKKLYIAYKLDSNFVSIISRSSKLVLNLSLEIDELDDPRKIAKYISKTEHLGSSKVRFEIFSQNDLDYAMFLIKQAFDKQYQSNF